MGSRPYERSYSISRYLSEISAFPLLTKEEEQAIASAVHKARKLDQKNGTANGKLNGTAPGTANGTGKSNGLRKTAAPSLNDLVESNLSFVVKIAGEYRNLGLPFEDLLNEGNIGLIQAAHRYDHRRGTKFITYAIWWIRKSILKALSQHSSLVRIPNYQMKKFRAIRNTERKLSRTLGRQPRREEICEEMQSTLAKLDRVLQLRLRELSLDEMVGKDRDTPISDYLIDGRMVSPEEQLIKEESQTLIRLAMKGLNTQEQTVIINRFGLRSGKTFTLKQIGEKMGVSRERVRQIEFQAKRRMMKTLTKFHRGLVHSRPLNGRAPTLFRSRLRILS